jgi:hypothetical protein
MRSLPIVLILTLLVAANCATDSYAEGRCRHFVYSDSLVRIAQQALLDKKYHPGVVDGKYGWRTRLEVLNFQKRNALPADGDLTAETMTKLVGTPYELKAGDRQISYAGC